MNSKSCIHIRGKVSFVGSRLLPKFWSKKPQVTTKVTLTSHQHGLLISPTKVKLLRWFKALSRTTSKRLNNDLCRTSRQRICTDQRHR